MNLVPISSRRRRPPLSSWPPVAATTPTARLGRDDGRVMKRRKKYKRTMKPLSESCLLGTHHHSDLLFWPTYVFIRHYLFTITTATLSLPCWHITQNKIHITLHITSVIIYILVCMYIHTYVRTDVRCVDKCHKDKSKRAMFRSKVYDVYKVWYVIFQIVMLEAFVHSTIRLSKLRNRLCLFLNLYMYSLLYMINTERLTLSNARFR